MLLVRTVGTGAVRYFLDGRHPGFWSPGATRLLGVAGPVQPAELRRVLQGRDPHSGRFLPARSPARRRPGWDLLFCAPKSVSLGQTGDDTGRRPVMAAHEAAVAAVLDHIEGGLMASRSSGGGHMPGEGLVAAGFVHTANAAGEPHVHTHVLVANLTRAAGGWGAIVSPWYVERAALGALYQLELRHQMAARGLHTEWRIRPDGLADMASVPRAALRAASSQGRLAADLGPLRARLRASPQPWRQKVARVGWPRESGRADTPAEAMTADLHRAVTARLALRRSDFRRADVTVALAAACPAGLPLTDALDWVDGFCNAAIPVPSPTSGRRWTTPLARDIDDRVTALLSGPPGPDASQPDPLADISGPALDRLLEMVRERRAVHLGSPPGRSALVAQADLLDLANRTWARDGVAAAVDTITDVAAQRWAALTGIPRLGPGPLPPIVVVDAVDRRSSAELAALLSRCRDRNCGVVLVEGGSMPRLTNPASHGWDRAVRDGRLPPGDHRPWDLTGHGGRSPSGLVVGRDAAAVVLRAWAAGHGADGPPLLVGLGIEEVAGLNRAARLLATGADVESRGGLAHGDRVVVLSGRGAPGRGSFGTVIGQDPRSGEVTVEWDGAGAASVHHRDLLGRLGLGWAATPGVAARAGRPAVLLGPERAAPQLSRHLIASVPAPTTPGERILWQPTP